MTINLKYVAYVALAAVSIFCGRGFYALYKASAYSDKKARQFEEVSTTGQEGRASQQGAQTNKPVIVSNLVSAATNVTLGFTNTAPAESDVVSPTNLPATNLVAIETNLAARGTNTVIPATNQASVPAIQPASQSSTGAVVSAETAPKKKPRYGLIMSYLGGFLASTIILGMMIARDFSSMMGDEALELLFNDDGKGIKNPEYENAEHTWVNGDYLEAIRLMRDYYQRNPREVFVALRIAEIYEKDLGNFLAAALEYEEILQKNLPPDKWGWSAIHLCNLYYKLQQEPKATALLNRIVKEYGKTPAAKKARKRLGIPEPVDSTSGDDDNGGESIDDEFPPAPEAPPSNLPPGFRPKKR